MLTPSTVKKNGQTALEVFMFVVNSSLVLET